MHQTALEPFSLYVFDVESGLWVSVTLGSPVSLRIQEAMNLILTKDGILAFIGTKSEFGHYMSELKKETGKGFPDCWTSLPASTILGILGLCLTTGKLGKQEIVCYGSPLTLMLALILEYGKDKYGGRLASIEARMRNSGFIYLTGNDLEAIVSPSLRMINASEYEEAKAYAELSFEEPRIDNPIDAVLSPLGEVL
jgi:hypothetical protein